MSERGHAELHLSIHNTVTTNRITAFESDIKLTKHFDWSFATSGSTLKLLLIIQKINSIHCSSKSNVSFCHIADIHRFGAISKAHSVEEFIVRGTSDSRHEMNSEMLLDLNKICDNYSNKRTL